jgi:hypothetical protein
MWLVHASEKHLDQIGRRRTTRNQHRIRPMDNVSSSDVVDDSEHAKKRKLDSTDVIETVSMSEDDIRKMVKSFNYDQLVQLMTSICVKNADAARCLHDDWSNDVNNRKLYIRNLNVSYLLDIL